MPQRIRVIAQFQPTAAGTEGGIKETAPLHPPAVILVSLDAGEGEDLRSSESVHRPEDQSPEALPRRGRCVFG